MNELNFDSPLNGGEHLLKEFVCGLMLFKGWEIVKRGVSAKMKDYMPDKHPLIDNLDMDTKFLLFLEVIGPEFRNLWGGQALERYKPELLREPYITEERRDELLELLNVIYLAYTEELMSDDTELTFEKHAYFVETKAYYQTLLKYKEEREKGNRSIIREDLGCALTAIMKNEDLLVRLLSTPLTPESAYNRRLNDTADAQQYGLGLGGAMKTQEDLEEEEVRNIVARFNKETVDDMCLHLRGSFLSDSLRSELWAFRYLTRNSAEPPNTKNATPGRDYRRLAKEKGVDLARVHSSGVVSSSSTRSRSSGSSSMLQMANQSAMHALISESVWTCLQLAVSTSVNIAARKAQAVAANCERGDGAALRQDDHAVSPTDAAQKKEAKGSLGGPQTFGAASEPAGIRALARRVELLVFAGYILNDDMSNRSINVAIMLLRAFPQEPPTSEKMLRMYQRILTECMPSEQLHKDYSLASVAHVAWGLLLQRDPSLLHFLQNYEINVNGEMNGDVDDDEGDDFGEEDGMVVERRKTHHPKRLERDASTSSNAAVEIPRSLLLLQGWLEDGFIGKVPEYAALYIWDQLTLFGACPTDFRKMLPVLCCIILQALREPIMALPKNLDLVAALHELGMDLRTRDLVELIRAEEAFAPLAGEPKQAKGEVIE